MSTKSIELQMEKSSEGDRLYTRQTFGNKAGNI